MEKYAIIDIKRIRAWFFDRKVKKRIIQANKLAKLTKYKYLVLIYKGKLITVRKGDLKRLIRFGKFKKGTTIQDLERSALYITTS
ncbi:MAG: hypothetical protein U9N85_01125 [Bacteroidota bacterium]|nr:hypothetical protein [Bacteroidota bacterium]